MGASTWGLALRPKSFFSLVLLGFCLVVSPLAVALVSAVFYVDRLFVQSEYAVYRAAEASKISRTLVGQISDMERNVRQYQVLSDAALWDGYLSRREQFRESVKELSGLAESQLLKGQLETLDVKEQVLYQALARRDQAPLAKVDSKEEFEGLSQLVQAIVQESQSWISSQVSLLSSMADETEKLLMWQAMALVPGTILFAVFISALIARPIRQLDHAIRHLGDGRFDEEIEVRGPRDLRNLGERLNWLRQRLRELDERKGNFLRHVSHELKTPLTALREGSALLAEGLLGDLNRRQRDVLDVLQRNALSLQRMIENLLNFNMLETKRAELAVGNVRLDKVVDDVAADHKLALLAKKLRLELDCERVELEGDAGKLRTVIDNLLSNAIKYSPERGRLRIALSEVGEQVRLDVYDEGPGIAGADAERVFEAFYRGHSGRARGEVRGSGVGLAIAKEFVDVHGGRIEVVQDVPSGAHFSVTLPGRQKRAVA